MRFGNEISKPYFPSSSVIQGSKLSSLFFSIVIDGIGEAINHSQYLLFADDFKLFLKVKTAQDCQLLQQDINSVSEWLSQISLKFNPKKCEVMTFTRTKKTSIIYDYSLYNNKLTRVIIVKKIWEYCSKPI